MRFIRKMFGMWTVPASSPPISSVGLALAIDARETNGDGVGSQGHFAVRDHAGVLPEPVVVEDQTPVFQVERESAVDRADGCEHTLFVMAVPFDLGGQRPRAVAERRRRIGGHVRHRRVVHELVSRTRGARPPRAGKQLHGAVVEREYAVLTRFRPTSARSARGASPGALGRGRCTPRNLRRGDTAPHSSSSKSVPGR